MMVAMLVAASGSVSAQSVAEGSRVRVKTADSRTVGTLLSQSAKYLTLWKEPGGEVEIAWVDVERLEESWGQKRNLAKGAAIGLGVGLLGGLAAGRGCNDNWIFSESECRTMDAIGGGLLGVIGGALIGLGIKTERWERVDTGPRIVLTLPPRSVGAQLQVGW